MSKLKPFDSFCFLLYTYYNYYIVYKENKNFWIFMLENTEEDTITCCVKNCQKKIPRDQAIVIKDKYFCGICGVAYYRSSLNL